MLSAELKFIVTSCLLALTGAFVSVPLRSIGGASNLHSSNDQADFEFQELRIQLDAMQERGLVSRDLLPETRLGLEAYAREVARNRNSPVELAAIGNKLPNTTWKLAFSTNSAALGDLPRDATVLLKFREEGNVDYCLEFEKTWGLNGIKAASTYSINPGPIDAGVVTITYDRITTDVFGLKDVGAGLFGLLQGRANYIVTAFFDGDYWIERGRGPEEDTDYLSVYIRQPDPDDTW